LTKGHPTFYQRPFSGSYYDRETDRAGQKIASEGACKKARGEKSEPLLLPKSDSLFTVPFERIYFIVLNATLSE
jgi:hypothetical protein